MNPSGFYVDPKKVGMSICFFGHLKEEKYKWGQIDFH